MPNSSRTAGAERERERQADGVELRLKLDRKRADHRHRAQRVGRPDRDRRAERGAEQRQQQVLGQQQADDAPRAGAEREAHADLALPRAGARQHQVRGVAADREQQQQHDALQHRQRARRASAAVRAAPARTAAPRRRSSRWSRDRSRASSRIADVELGLRLRRASPRREPAERRSSRAAPRSSSSRDPASSAGAIVAGTHRSKFSIEHRALKPLRRDADDRQRPIVDAQRAAEHVRVAARIASASSRTR